MVDHAIDKLGEPRFVARDGDKGRAMRLETPQVVQRAGDVVPMRRLLVEARALHIAEQLHQRRGQVHLRCLMALERVAPLRRSRTTRSRVGVPQVRLRLARHVDVEQHRAELCAQVRRPHVRRRCQERRQKRRQRRDARRIDATEGLHGSIADELQHLDHVLHKVLAEHRRLPGRRHRERDGHFVRAVAAHTQQPVPGHCAEAEYGALDVWVLQQNVLKEQRAEQLVQLHGGGWVVPRLTLKVPDLAFQQRVPAGHGHNGDVQSAYGQEKTPRDELEV
mmetsp:Transcript_23149/g.80667  ORF Transcript_23149/g.80667 Transcript_23149/m.80667 type:complete len:278 (+) Transcript_23149:1013-1846(+)